MHWRSNGAAQVSTSWNLEEMEPVHHTPSFFTTMVESQSVARIPQMFSQFLPEEFSNTATLIGPTGETWTVCVKISGCRQIKLSKGWEKFCEDNYIGPIDVLLLSYEGNMRFRVEIFEPSGVKKMVQVLVPSASASSSPAAVKTTHGASSGKSNLTDSENPYFETIVTENFKGNKLFFPSKFLKEQGVTLSSEMTYRDPAGRELKGKVGEWGDGRVYVTGWKSLVNSNKFVTGQKLIIELVMPTDATAEKFCCHMNVHFQEPWRKC